MLLMPVICNGYAQQSGCDCAAENDYSAKLRAGLMGPEYRNPISGYKGKQYFNEWTMGDITMANGDEIRGVNIRYDEYLDELLWLRKSDMLIGVLIKKDITGFRLYDYRDELSATFVKKQISIPFIYSADVFLQLLVPGDLAFYAFRNATIKASDIILVDNTKYIVSSRGKDYLLKLNRKNLLNVPGIDAVKMRNILRSNRITVRNDEQEFSMAVRLYNQAQP